jgi:misacylated tRNA(Ala) deacylase
MHTAQHLISAVADEFWGGRTVGNQIRLDCTRIDLGFENRDLFDSDMLQQSVNEYVKADLPVFMDFQERSMLVQNPLVRVNMDLIPKHIDNLRVITIVGVDICPCAGTHVESTGQIGQIEIGRIRSKGAGKLRVEYTLND